MSGIDRISVEIRIAGINQAVQIVILTGVVLTIEIAIQPAGLIRIAGVEYPISVASPLGGPSGT